MKRALLILLLAPAMAFGEDLIMRGNGTDSIRLTDAPCISVKGVFESMPKEVRALMHAAVVFWKGDAYEACWADVNTQQYFVIDETGDNGLIAKDSFRPVYGI